MSSRTPRGTPQSAADAWQQVRDTSPDTEYAWSCRTITPLYGGGVLPGEVDTEMPVRSSAIRGQLRFWWRTLNRHRFAEANDLFRAEIELWGGMSADGPRASRVRLRVDTGEIATPRPAFEFQPKPGGGFKSMPKPAPWISAYALFSAQGKLTDGGQRIENPPAKLADAGLAFTLKILLKEGLSSELCDQVIESVRWWSAFGGIGARTRRGSGAVQTNGFVPVIDKEVKALGGRLELSRQTHTSAIKAWKEAVNHLKDFRQTPDIGRGPYNDETRRPGRSHWPEADEIRRKSGMNADTHPPKHRVQTAYPRAAFGLPIVFQYKDVTRDPKHSDPLPHVLEPSDEKPDTKRDRMASPLILRPYWDGRHYRAAALLLPNWQAVLDQELKLRPQAGGTPHTGLTTWPSDNRQRQATAADIPPMAGHTDDPLNAFLDFFAKRGA